MHRCEFRLGLARWIPSGYYLVMQPRLPMIHVRLAQEIRDDLQRFAETHGTSINAAVNLLLRQALDAAAKRSS